MNVLHVIDSGGIYGAEKVLLTLIEQQRRSGMHASLAAIRSGEHERAIERAAAARGIDVVPFEMGWGFSATGGRAILDFASQNAVDVVHSHSYKSNIVLSLLRRGRNPALMTTLHGWSGRHCLSKLWWYESLDRRTLRRMDAVAAVSSEMAKRHRLRDAVGARLHVVHNGLPATDEAASQSAQPAIKEFCQRAFTVAAFGRLSSEKGVDVLIAALAILKKRGEPVQALVVGDGPERTRLLEQVNDEGLAEYIWFAGYIDNAAHLLRYVNAYVLPSRTEGLPVVLLEAARVGTPIVSTSVGGIPEFIVDGVSGLLCGRDDPMQLANAVSRLRSDPALQGRLGHAAGRTFREHFTADVMERAYARVYASLILLRHDSRSAV